MAVRGPAWRLVSGGFDGGSSSGGRPFEEVPKGVMNGVNRTFTLTYTPWLGFVQLFLNGNEQNKFVPRFAISGNVITYAVAPKADDEHYCWYFRGPGGSSILSGARGFGSQGVDANDGVNWGSIVSSPLRIVGNLGIGMWVKLPSDAQGTLFHAGIPSASLDANTAWPYFIGVLASSGNKIVVGHDTASVNINNSASPFTTGILNDIWTYVGLSRDTTAKTYKLYVGDGTTVTLIGTYTYSDNPSATAGTAAGSIATISTGDYRSDLGIVHLNAAVAEHYIWNVAPSLSDHASAMAGSPLSSGLVLSCHLGKSPETDIVGSNGTPSITGTLVVEGH